MTEPAKAEQPQDDQPKARHTPEVNLTFGNVDTKGGNFTATGDNNEDNSVGKTHNESHGAGATINSTQANNFDGPQVCFDELVAALLEEAGTLPEEEIEAALPVRTDTAEEPADLEPLDFDAMALEPIPEFSGNENHPAVVSRMVSNYASAGVPMTQEEQKGLFARALSCFTRYATAPATIAAGKMTLAGMKATASLAPPFNIIVPVIETGIRIATEGFSDH